MKILFNWYFWYEKKKGLSERWCEVWHGMASSVGTFGYPRHLRSSFPHFSKPQQVIRKQSHVDFLGLSWWKTVKSQTCQEALVSLQLTMKLLLKFLLERPCHSLTLNRSYCISFSKRCIDSKKSNARGRTGQGRWISTKSPQHPLTALFFPGTHSAKMSWLTLTNAPQAKVYNALAWPRPGFKPFPELVSHSSKKWTTFSLRLCLPS